MTASFNALKKTPAYVASRLHLLYPELRLGPLPQSRQAAGAALSAAEAHLRTLQLDRDRIAKTFADAQKVRSCRRMHVRGQAAYLRAASQTWQLREGELLSRVLELQDALAKSTESAAALEAALRARHSTSEAALLAPSVTEQAQVELPTRRGEVAELRRQLKMLEDTRRHEQRMLLDAEERAQALASVAAVRTELCLCLNPGVSGAFVCRRLTIGRFKS